MEDYLSPRQIAEILGLSLNTVYRLLSSGEIPGRHIGRQWRVSAKALDEWSRQRPERIAT